MLAGKATTFINSAAQAHDPFLLEVATFAPHEPYTPAPRDQNAFPGLSAPRDPNNTIVLFSSDNGYHMGEYRLTWGKMTAFDTDARAPLVAAGPNFTTL